MPPKTAAISNEALRPRLANTPMTAQDIRALMRNEAWNAIDARNSQIVFLISFAESECGISLDNRTLADIFQLTPPRVHQIRCKAALKPKVDHRPLTLTSDQEEAIDLFISGEASRGNFVTQRMVLRFVEENFGKSLTYGWIEGFLSRRTSQIEKMTIAPQELTRMQIPRSYLDRYIALIKTYVPLVPAELIFNMDETGLSDWEERRPKRVLVPIHAGDSQLHYPVDRRIRHQTLLCCVSASGDAYCPLLVSAYSQASSVFDCGLRDGIDVKIEIRDSPYINAELFEQYVRDVFFPMVESNRGLPGCERKPAILFCDNCCAHCRQDFLRELAEHGVLLITYPPHTSHIFQVLDLLIFGRLKVAKKHQPHDPDLDYRLDHIVRILRAYEIATTSFTIRGSWEKTGFGYVKRDQTFYLYVNEQKIRSSPDFAELWQLDYPELQLTERRRQQKWGWLNQQFFREEYNGNPIPK